MNILLLHSTDFYKGVNEGEVKLEGRRAAHLRNVNRVQVGDGLKAGMVNGKIGECVVTHIDAESVILRVSKHLSLEPPSSLPLHLVIALPRPKMLKRILQTIATMGVKELTFINSYRVEKSYWQTPLLKSESIQEQLILGLEQGVDTRLPVVHMEKRFKPFVEDTLPALCTERRALVAHPHRASLCPPADDKPTLLVIGPEGGFIDYEVRKLNEAGCETIHLGRRILRVETAVPVLLSRLFPLS